jgi:hypothetical protein
MAPKQPPLSKKVEESLKNVDNIEALAQEAADKGVDQLLNEVQVATPELPKVEAKQPTAMTSAAVTAVAENVKTDIKMSEEELNTAEAKKLKFESFMHPATAKAIEELMARQDIDWSKVDERHILSDAIVALDLKLPAYLDIKLKDPVYMGMWVNRKFNGEGGNRYEAMKAIGFMNVDPSDCLGPFDPNRITCQDGGIMCGDLIFMKIPKPLLFGYYKNNYIKANKTFSRQNVHEQAKRAAIQEFKGSGLSKDAYAGKVSFFTPNRIPSEAIESLDGDV